MEDKNIRQALVFIKNLWLKYIKNNLFRVKVENQVKLPEVQKVRIENQKEVQAVRVLNQKNIQQVQVVNETSLDSFVNDIVKIFETQIEKISELKDNKEIVAKLDELKPIKSENRSEETIQGLKSVVTAIKNVNLNIDTSNIEKGLKSLEKQIKNIKLEESFKPKDLQKIVDSIYIPTPAKSVKIRNSAGNDINPATEDTLQKLVGFDIGEYDYIDLSYTGSDLTGVVYKLGGSSGTTVATLTLAYSGGNLISVTQT